MKIGFLITARLKSSRLPMKLLKKLNGKTVIQHVIDRVKKIEGVSTIIMCTSINPQDLPLIEISKENNIFYFAGNEEDVLSRLNTAAKLFGLDYFIGITGENPLFSLENTAKIIEETKTGNYDFIYSSGLPIGCATYALKTKALETVCAYKQIVDTEIWGYLVNRPEIFNIKELQVPDVLTWPDLRITMDYPEDFEFIETIYKHTDKLDLDNLGQVLNFLRANPEIPKIHAHKIQLDLDLDTQKQINDYFEQNQEEILAIKNKIYAQ